MQFFLRSILLLLLIVSVSLKVSGATDSRPDPSITIKEATLALLKQHGFQATEIREDVDLSLITAHGTDCRLRLATASLRGWHRDVIRQLAGPHEQVSFVYGGVIYPDQPVWRTRAQFYWSQFHRYAGIAIPIRPVIGVISTPLCALNEIAWEDIAELSEN